jgi:hypothetical protein
VALEGEDGTVSEAIFCISLGKPVVFVGNRWKSYRLDGPGDSVDWDAMVTAAFRRVGEIPPQYAPLNHLFARTKVRAQVGSGMYTWFGTPASKNEASIVVTDALRWLRGASAGKFSGTFPNLGGYDAVEAAYNSWL